MSIEIVTKFFGNRTGGQLGMINPLEVIVDEDEEDLAKGLSYSVLTRALSTLNIVEGRIIDTFKFSEISIEVYVESLVCILCNVREQCQYVRFDVRIEIRHECFQCRSKIQA